MGNLVISPFFSEQESLVSFDGNLVGTGSLKARGVGPCFFFLATCFFFRFFFFEVFLVPACKGL